LLVVCLPLTATAGGWRKEGDSGELTRINNCLKGKVVDHTFNHGHDNRIWSPALYQRRDLYVYLPPNFDPCRRYPLVLWLHGFAQDEQSFLYMVAPLLDRAIRCGKLPPLIAAAPDGSLDGEPSLFSAGSFYLNSKAGDFEDYLLTDVWDYVVTHYPILPDREAHVIAGVSMGGFAAYNQAIKHRECFGVVIGVYPPLNLRWADCKGNYLANFDPAKWGWRTNVDYGCEVVAKFLCGAVNIHLKQIVDPIFGRGPGAVAEIARENPIEMIDRCHLCPGELEMYVGYGGKDQFNIDAQVESFLYLARSRGLCLKVGYEPNGHHDFRTALKLFPGIVDWLAPLLAPFSPPPCCGETCPPPCAAE
jgi:hypothetical protein